MGKKRDYDLYLEMKNGRKGRAGRRLTRKGAIEFARMLRDKRKRKIPIGDKKAKAAYSFNQRLKRVRVIKVK